MPTFLEFPPLWGSLFSVSSCSPPSPVDLGIGSSSLLGSQKSAALPPSWTATSRVEDTSTSVVRRSVSEVLPFLNLDRGGRGIVLGIGWTGQWALDVRVTDRGEPSSLSFGFGSRVNRNQLQVFARHTTRRSCAAWS